MIEKIHGTFIAMCDQCGEEHDETFDTFDDVVRALRLNGWTATKIGDLWVNICPNCREVE